MSEICIDANTVPDVSVSGMEHMFVKPWGWVTLCHAGSVTGPRAGHGSITEHFSL